MNKLTKALLTAFAAMALFSCNKNNDTKPGESDNNQDTKVITTPTVTIAADTIEIFIGAANQISSIAYFGKNGDRPVLCQFTGVGPDGRSVDNGQNSYATITGNFFNDSARDLTTIPTNWDATMMVKGINTQTKMDIDVVKPIKNSEGLTHATFTANENTFVIMEIDAKDKLAGYKANSQRMVNDYNPYFKKYFADHEMFAKITPR